MDAKKGKLIVISLYSFFRVGKSGCFPYKSYLELHGPDQSRFVCLGGFLGKGFDVGQVAKKRMVFGEPLLSLYRRVRVGKLYSSPLCPSLRIMDFDFLVVYS